jgi:hypothetical protein
MADILTEVESSSNRRRSVYSKLSFIFSVLSICLLTVSFWSMSWPHYRTMTKFLVKAIQGTVFLGLIFSVISIVRKEKIKYIKLIGLILNLLLVLFLIATVIFATVMDSRKFH